MTHLLYIANVRMPTEKAHGIQIVKTCEAFVNAGAGVELVVPERTTHIAGDAFSYYGLKTRFPITKLNVWDVVRWGRIGFFIESIQFAFAAARFSRYRDALVYGRDEVVLFAIALLTNREIVWESHTGAWNLCARFIAKRAKGIVVISQSLREFYISNGIAVGKIIVAHDGIDLTDFQTPETKKDARARLRISQNAKIALYIGALGMWKGTGTLLEASNLLPDDIQIAIISISNVESFRKKYPRVLFLGEKPYREIASNQQAADVLILPTSAKDVVGAKYTSPLKLFTYMASEIPIVASDVPSTKEVLPKNAAYWFKPDDAHDLARAIQEAVSDSSAGEKAALAKQQVLLYTWEERAKRILTSL